MKSSASPPKPAIGNPFELKLYGWLRDLVKLRDIFMADPATAQLLVA
jgi:hypothetical protein